MTSRRMKKSFAPTEAMLCILSIGFLVLFGGATAFSEKAGADMPTVSIDKSKTSISGISAGGFQAVQLHVAFSSSFIGVGVIAGGPFYCSMNNVDIALTTCMTNGKAIDADVLAGITRNTALYGFVDDPSHLEQDQIYVLSARNDTVVDRMVVQKLQEYYLNFIDNPHEQIRAVYDVDGEHSQLTKNYGNPCTRLGSPYINDCNYDAAGAILQHIFQGKLNEPKTLSYTGKIYKFNQAAFVDGPIWSESFGLNPTGAVYVPTQCQDGRKTCILHVALHGCEMNFELIQEQYVEHSGYNAWADANDMVILYPQAHSNVLNPKGCFDWWGYSGTAFASNIGVQPLAIKRMMDTLQGSPLTKNESSNWPDDPMSAFTPDKQTTLLRSQS